MDAYAYGVWISLLWCAIAAAVPLDNCLPISTFQDVMLFPNATTASIESNVITLCPLQPSTSYEARVSYIGTIPYDIELKWVQPMTLETGRRLLDIEKIIFSTDEHGNVLSLTPSTSTPSLLIIAHWSGRTYDINVRSRPITTRLIVEPLIFGAPPIVLRVVPWILILLFVAYKWLVPFLLRRLHVADYLVPDPLPKQS